MNRAEQEHQRLRDCGLVYHERQVNGEAWIGPPESHPATLGRVKVLPLTDANVKPKPNLRVQATDGERYLIPYNFRGTWFDVVSPKGVKLIA